MINRILLGGVATFVGVAALPATAHAAVSPPGVPSITSVARGGDGIATINVSPATTGPATTSIKVTASPSGKTCTAKLPATNCNITGLTNGSTYTFTATATGTTGTSAASTPSDALLVGRRPFKPGNFIATAAMGGQARLTWTASANGGLPFTGYRVTSSTGAPGCSTDGAATSCTITGLTPGTKYNWSLVAVNDAGASDAAVSNTITAVAASKPDTPTVTGSERVGDGKVKVSVAAGKDNGSPITSIVVRTDQLKADGTWARVSTRWCSLTPPATDCTIIGLTNGTTYRFLAEASNAVGTSKLSDPAATLKAAWVPSRPQNVTLTAVGGGSVQVTWTAPASSGGLTISKYTVATTAGQTCSTTGEMQCTLTNLKPGSKYTVSMTASNEVGTSPLTLAKQIVAQ